MIVGVVGPDLGLEIVIARGAPVVIENVIEAGDPGLALESGIDGGHGHGQETVDTDIEAEVADEIAALVAEALPVTGKKRTSVTGERIFSFCFEFYCSLNNSLRL